MFLVTFSHLGTGGRLLRTFNRVVSFVARHTMLGHWMTHHVERHLPPRPCRVLFVCRGNICRSAYAEAAARASAPARGGWSFASGGLAARLEGAAPVLACSVARERGVDLRQHRARGVNSLDPAAFDVVFVMEPSQLTHRILAPFRARAPVLLLGPLAGDPLIADPYGHDDATFRRCFEQIDRALSRLLEYTS